jgi:hypothetical protein
VLIPVGQFPSVQPGTVSSTGPLLFSHDPSLQVSSVGAVIVPTSGSKTSRVSSCFPCLHAQLSGQGQGTSARPSPLSTTPFPPHSPQHSLLSSCGFDLLHKTRQHPRLIAAEMSETVGEKVDPIPRNAISKTFFTVVLPSSQAVCVEEIRRTRSVQNCRFVDTCHLCHLHLPKTYILEKRLACHQGSVAQSLNVDPMSCR